MYATSVVYEILCIQVKVQLSFKVSLLGSVFLKTAKNIRVLVDMLCASDALQCCVVYLRIREGTGCILMPTIRDES